MKKIEENVVKERCKILRSMRGKITGFNCNHCGEHVPFREVIKHQKDKHPEEFRQAREEALKRCYPN